MTEPTDAAIDTLILEHGVMGQAWPTQRQLHAFARAVLAKWGTPSQKTNQCGEVCERAKLCAICAGGLEDTTAPVGVEPVAIYHGRCVIDCGEHGHLDMELLKMIPAGTKLYTAEQVLAMGRVPQVDAAAKALAECMDYPWEHMPEAGRQAMREHAQKVLSAAHGIKGGQHGAE